MEFIAGLGVRRKKIRKGLNFIFQELLTKSDEIWTYALFMPFLLFYRNCCLESIVGRTEIVLCFTQALRANIETLAIMATVSSETSVHGVVSPTTAVLTNAVFASCKVEPYKINEVVYCFYLIRITNSKCCPVAQSV